MNLYFDNSSTSFPKPKCVLDSIEHFSHNIGSSPGRGYYDLAIKSDKILFKCRESIANMFNFNKTENIIFSHNATYAFNILLSSIKDSKLFDDKPHILVSKLDHNATMRPLTNLNLKGKINLEFINCTDDFFIDICDLENKITSKTKFVIISHMSNVLGNIQDINIISSICKKNNIHLIIDMAQSAGIVSLDLSKTYFSAIIFTGHKNLYSTSGIGGFIISDELLKECDNYFLGGTGSLSSELITKSCMPDYFEVGTHNMIGVTSLLKGVEYINSIGINNIFNQKKEIINNIYNKICNISDIIVLNNVQLKNQNSNLCINFRDITPDKASFILNKEFNICVRSGLHCAPNTHKLIGTFPNGCIRISPSIFNTSEDIDYLVSSLYKISRNKF